MKFQEEARAHQADCVTYFLPELSFYSSFHGGTFHFLQLNVLHADEFIKSVEFKHLLEFLKETYKDT